MKPKTQRGFAWNNGNGTLWRDRCGAFVFDDVVTQEVVGSEGNVPVLVVPEEAVTGCKHEPSLDCLGWCPACGSHLVDGRWQRPRVLRAGRVRK